MLLKGVGDLYSKMTGGGRTRIDQQIDMLYRWHAPDASGEQSWKNARLSVSIAELSSAIEKQTEMMRAFTTEIHDMQLVVKKCDLPNK